MKAQYIFMYHTYTYMLSRIRMTQRNHRQAHMQNQDEGYLKWHPVILELFLFSVA